MANKSANALNTKLATSSSEAVRCAYDASTAAEQYLSLRESSSHINLPSEISSIYQFIRNKTGDAAFKAELCELQVFVASLASSSSEQSQLNFAVSLCKLLVQLFKNERLSKTEAEGIMKIRLSQQEYEYLMVISKSLLAKIGKEWTTYVNDALFREVPYGTHLHDVLERYEETRALSTDMSKEDSRLSSSIATLQPWLRSKLESSQIASIVPVEELFSSVWQLFSDKSLPEEQFQSDVVNLLGFEALELVRELCQRRHHFFEEANSSGEEWESWMAPVSSLKKTEKMTLSTNSISEFINQVPTESTSLENSEYVQMAREVAQKQAATYNSLPHVYITQSTTDGAQNSALPASNTPSFMSSSLHMATQLKNNTAQLPPNAVRQYHNTYDQVTLPAIKRDNNAPSYRVPIDQVNRHTREAFAKYTHLNRMQSLVFEAAYKTHENLLICAPTGAGKTDVAMLTILREIEQHMKIAGQGVEVNLDAFKIVYVAPMKALAAEMTENFSRRLKFLNVTVRELTGDMQLTKAEILSTQIIVTTPEKWDVITRKSTGDVALVQKVKLLIIDEVHLLHDDRGPVIESLIARTIRQVESTQSMIRIVGLSATLPNFLDVAEFLRVNPQTGLFYFDGGFRPVPLVQHFIGVKATSPFKQQSDMNDICFDKVLEYVSQGHQAMVFVHARKETVKTAQMLRNTAQQENVLTSFSATPYIEPSLFQHAQRLMDKSRNTELRQLFPHGFGIHHAGMLRSDRTLVERLFEQGHIRVLVCTSTLAWGVNLPAHAVIIKGTDVYDSQRGMFMDMGVLDVLQIFGRAGRPQYESHGEGLILTSHRKLQHYLLLLTQQLPIESQLIARLPDHLNAEVALGTVSTVEEAVQWLSYTYLWVRMRRNPAHYGLTYLEIRDDTGLREKRRALILGAIQTLEGCRMLRFHADNELLVSLDHGRTASHYYVRHDTVSLWQREMTRRQQEEGSIGFSEADVLSLISQSAEFEQLKVRDDELLELDRLAHDVCLCDLGPARDIHEEKEKENGKEGKESKEGGKEGKEGKEGEKTVSSASSAAAQQGLLVLDTQGKVNVLLQAYLSRATLSDFALISDMAYVAQNGRRLMRALLDIALQRRWARHVRTLLGLCIAMDRQRWPCDHPLRQFELLPDAALSRLEMEDVRVLRTEKNLARWVPLKKHAELIGRYAQQFPLIGVWVEAVQPIGPDLVRLRVAVWRDFQWNERVHGSEPFYVAVECDDARLLDIQLVHLRREHTAEQALSLDFHIPLLKAQKHPSYALVARSDRWMHSETRLVLPLEKVTMPATQTLTAIPSSLQPLSLTVLKHPALEQHYRILSYPVSLNALQSRCFHDVYHSDVSFLLGAPLGSGVSFLVECALWRALYRHRQSAVMLYVHPVAARCQQRAASWTALLAPLGIHCALLSNAQDCLISFVADGRPQLLFMTPDILIHRLRHHHQSSSSFAHLVILDDLHLIETHPVYERAISLLLLLQSSSLFSSSSLRLAVLSLPMQHVEDVARWLNITLVWNISPSTHTSALHITGVAGPTYDIRMAAMHRPVYAALQRALVSPQSVGILLVASRRQARLTAQALINFSANDESAARPLLKQQQYYRGAVIRDAMLRWALPFGMGIHHEGLSSEDTQTLCQLVEEGLVRVVISTETWHPFQGHPRVAMVAVLGTEGFDTRLRLYRPLPLVDLMHRLGGQQQQQENACLLLLLLQDTQRDRYRKQLSECVSIESGMTEKGALAMLLMAASDVIRDEENIVERVLRHTLYAHRWHANPWYYRRWTRQSTPFTAAGTAAVNGVLSQQMEEAMQWLMDAGCMRWMDDASMQLTGWGCTAMALDVSVTTVRQLRDLCQHDQEERTHSDPNWKAVLLEKLCDTETCLAVELHAHPDRVHREMARWMSLEENNNNSSKKVDMESEEGMDDRKLEWMSETRWRGWLLRMHMDRMALPGATYRMDVQRMVNVMRRILRMLVDVCASMQQTGLLRRALALLPMLQQASGCDTLQEVDSEQLLAVYFDKACVAALQKNHITLDILRRSSQTRTDAMQSIADAALRERIEMVMKKWPPSVTVLRGRIVRHSQQIIVSVCWETITSRGDDAHCWWLLVTAIEGTEKKEKERVLALRWMEQTAKDKQEEVTLSCAALPGAGTVTVQLVSADHIGFHQSVMLT